jgi:hypothetical protein
MPPTPTSNTSVTDPAEILNVPAGYTYLHTALPSAEKFEDDEDTKHDTDFHPDMLTDEGLNNLCGAVMKVTFILKTRAAD